MESKESQKIVKKKISLSTMILIGIIFILIIYIGTIRYNNYMEKERLLYKSQGYDLAVIDILKSVSTCQEVPIGYGNVTLNVVAVECLKKQQAEAEQNNK